MPARLVVLRERLEHVGYDAGNLLDIVGRGRATNCGVGLHAKALHAEGKSPSADGPDNDAHGRASAILIAVLLSRQSPFVPFVDVVVLAPINWASLSRHRTLSIGLGSGSASQGLGGWRSVHSSGTNCVLPVESANPTILTPAMSLHLQISKRRPCQGWNG
jgi:hypothetical protein